VAGSVQRLPDRKGRPWRARFRGPDGREHSRTFPRKVEAAQWLRAQLTAIDAAGWVDPRAGRVTVAAVAEQWTAGLHGLKPKTVAGYGELLRSRVLPTFGSVEVRSVTSAAVRQWVAGMAGEGLSASRIRHALGVLSLVLTQAVSDGLVVRNVAAVVKSPPVRAGEPRFLDATQLTALADAAEQVSPGSGLVVDVLGWVGLRFGEAVALRASRVDVAAGRITVAEAATELDGRLVFGTPKSHRSRVVAVPRFLADRLADRLAEVNGDGLVFTAPRGGPLHGSNWRRRVWAPAVAAAGADPKLRPHDLRHSAASLMIATGGSIKAVQRQLGHASASMTLDRYGHLYPDDLDALAVALDATRATVSPNAAPRGHRGPETLTP